ncbi:MAG TPA: asparagine synthase (glutamine-hydrolyzing) [Candidatus Binatia bacterium]|nr:asparagine synthase (glutamine-hydrolyzing) [Candidatus Binatia bacterium]
MCGICGIAKFDGAGVRQEIVRRMADTLWHRGPDDAGYHFEPSLGLGHRRLSIIDLDSGHQPLANEDESIWVVFNGEIYNYLELRSQLEGKGHRFRTRSDTEVIVHLYEEVGEDCFARLRGMFAIALWDRTRQQVLLARDRIGKKPLFYFHDHSQLIFGSELKAILAARPDLDRLDLTALADYFTFLYIPAPKSIYQDIRKVPAAHYMVFSERGVRHQAYWDLRFDEVENRSEDQWAESIGNSLSEAVSVRLMSEVPLGAFLSGGVDSSAVAACMARLMDRPVTTCAVGFEEESYSEVRYAREAARHIGANYRQTIVRPDATAIVERLVWHYDEPFADSSAVPTYYVSKAAREHVTVALSGDGGDETFAGYKRYAYDAADNRIRALLPLGFRSSIVRPLANSYPPLEGAPRVLRGKAFLQRLSQDPLEGYLARITTPITLRESLLSNDLKRQLQDYDPLEQFREHYRRADTNDLLSRIQYLDVKTYLTDDICVKVDRAGMAVSLEVRAPLLDHKLMELAARMPSHLKLRRGAGKYIFKKSVERLLPPGFLDRPKQGFAVPVAEWFRGELRDWARDTLFAADGLLDHECLQLLWDRHQSRTQDHSAILWGIFMFRQWQRQVSASSDARTGLKNSFARL